MLSTDPCDLIAAFDAGHVVDPHALATGLLRRGLDDGQLERSVSNCHVAGMDSIVLFDHTAAGGGMVRFFFARHGQHRLSSLFTPAGHFTIGLHNHRYPIALVPLTGRLVNVDTELTDRPDAPVLHEYTFASALLDEDTTAVATVHQAARRHTGLERRTLEPGAVHRMAPEDLHTVLVPEQTGSPGTAWLVIEGPSTPDARSRIFSPEPDLAISSDDLYLPMSRERALGVTEAVLRLAEQG